jgi:hypothetical protein
VSFHRFSPLLAGAFCIPDGRLFFLGILALRRCLDSWKSALVDMALSVTGAGRLVERDLHAIGGLDARIVVSPGHLPCGRENLRAGLLEERDHAIGIRDRERQTHRAAHAPTHFHLVHKVGLRAIKEF